MNLHYSEYVLTTGQYAGQRLDFVPLSVQAAIARGWTDELYTLTDRKRCIEAIATDFGPDAIDQMFPLDAADRYEAKSSATPPPVGLGPLGDPPPRLRCKKAREMKS